MDLDLEKAATIVGVVTVIVSVCIFLIKVSFKNNIIISSLDVLREYLQKTHDFQTKLAIDIQQIQKSFDDQKRIIRAHSSIVIEIKESQKTMVRVFDDLKLLTKETNGTIIKIGAVMEHLLKIIEVKK